MKSIYKSAQGKAIIMERYEEILKLWPKPCESITVPSEYGDTFVIKSGADTDDAVVLLHGSSTNAAIWMGDAAILGKTRKVYAIDVIGEPGKSAETRPHMKAGNYAPWLEQVFDALGIKKAAIIGNSLGGWIALDFVSQSPLRVNKLVLLATGGLTPVHSSFGLKIVSLMLMGKKGVKKLTSIVLGNIEVPPEALEFAGLIVQYYIPRVIKSPMFSDDALSRLNMPVLFIGGENDAFFQSEKSAARLCSLVPQAKTQVLKNIAHTLINLADDIETFLDAKE